MVSLLEGLLSQTLPAIGSIDIARHLQRYVEVAAFNCQIEPSTLVLDEVQRNLPAKDQ